jgi:hypothetical protein
MSERPTEAGEAGWYPDPEAPTSLLRRWTGSAWTDDTRPTGYVVQPGGPPPVAGATGTPMYGSTPPPDPDPADARRRLRIGVGATALVVVAGVVLLLLGAFGVL